MHYLVSKPPYEVGTVIFPIKDEENWNLNEIEILILGHTAEIRTRLSDSCFITAVHHSLHQLLYTEGAQEQRASSYLPFLLCRFQERIQKLKAAAVLQSLYSLRGISLSRTSACFTPCLGFLVAALHLAFSEPWGRWVKTWFNFTSLPWKPQLLTFVSASTNCSKSRAPSHYQWYCSSSNGEDF